MQGGVMTDRGLRQVTALLVALAALADVAATRSFAVRWCVLVLLRLAEGASLKVLADATGWGRSDFDAALGIGGVDAPEAPLGSGSGPADALALAMRLRTLAALLRVFLPPDEPCGPGEACTATALVRHAARPALASAAWSGRAHPAPDTS